MRLITDLSEKDLSGKKVLLRVDFNVPVLNGKILETYRISAHKETIDYLISRGAIITLLSHSTAIDSFEPLLKQIKTILGTESFSLYENVRKFEGEENNDEEFARDLAKPFDIYVNDAFSESHRDYTSVTSVTKFLPSYAGLLLIKEIENLERVIQMPKENKTLIIGGAKAEVKFPVVENFLDKSEHILVGGVVANIFLKASGVDIGESVVDDNFILKAKSLILDKHIIVPEDFVTENNMILDIGPKTAENFFKIIKNSKLVIWNGPLGKVEVPEMSVGSKKIAEAIVSSGAFSVVGGGDTIAYLQKINLIGKFGYVSTGGGAMLEFLAGNTLPGLEALNYYNA